jgi:hypothetical protein
MLNVVAPHLQHQSDVCHKNFYYFFNNAPAKIS